MDAWVDAIVQPWSWGQSLRVYWPIIVEGALVSVALGVLGCFLVVRGMALLGDALSHSVLPGIVLGFLASAKFGTESLHSPWILVGATAFGLAAAVLVQAVQEHSRVKEDASLGIIFTSLFALGVVLINLYTGQTDLDPGCVLYGNIEYFVSFGGRVPDGLWPMAAITGGVIAGVCLFYRYLLVSTFDPGLAVSLGIPARAVHYVLMGVLSLAIVASFEAVGAILAVALLILPGATARLWTDRMPAMLLFAGGHGVASSLLGYWLSHPAVMNTSASGAICVAAFGLFLASWLLAPRHGLLPRAGARRRLRRTVALENLLKTIDELGLARGAERLPAADVRAEMGLPSRAFHATVARAAGRGWVRRETGGQLALTPAGRERSLRLIRAHELWERYLRQEVGLDPDHVHDAAEWIEHYLSDDKIDRLDAAVGAAGKG